MQQIEFVPELIQQLQFRGFSGVTRELDGWITLRGPLRTSLGEYQCLYTFDPSFFDLPRIRLDPVPRALLPVAPHLDANGRLCYLARKSIILDVFDPIGQALMCLERAEHVLGKLLRKEMVEDLADEFLAYWSDAFCFVDSSKLDTGRSACFVVHRGSWSLPVLTDNEERSSKKMERLRFLRDDKETYAFIVASNSRPRPSQIDWPPKTIRDFLRWQSQLDTGCSKKLLQRLYEAEKAGCENAVFLIRSPDLLYGVSVSFPDEPPRGSRSRRQSRAAVIYDAKITPLRAIRLDDAYVTQRSIPGRKTLQGLDLVLVGCGTIGGYLAGLLVKAGAGTGGGTLTLVDQEPLLPHNIGRHALGMGSVLSNKAIALAVELGFEWPGVSLRPLGKDVRKVSIGACSLVIDATGEEALGHWLAANLGGVAPMLSIWIEGPGVAARGLFKDIPECACFRCLSEYQRIKELATVHEPIRYELMGDGCEDIYVPFPATVSVQAAALGAEMVLDWVNGRPSPRLRTKVFSNDYTLATADCDPLRKPGCPVCRT